MDTLRREAAAQEEARKERFKNEDVRMTRLLSICNFRRDNNKFKPIVYEPHFDRVCVLSMNRSAFSQMAIPHTNLSLLHNDRVLYDRNLHQHNPEWEVPVEPIFIGFTVIRARAFSENMRIMRGDEVSVVDLIRAVAGNYNDARPLIYYCEEILKKVLDAGDPFDNSPKDPYISLAQPRPRN